MNPNTMQTFCQIMIAVGSFIVLAATYGSYHYGNKIEGKDSNNSGVQSYNQSGGITAHTVVLLDDSEVAKLSITQIFERLEKDLDETEKFYPKISGVQIFEADYQSLKSLVKQANAKFETEKLTRHYEKNEKNLLLLLSLVTKNFPEKMFSDEFLREIFIAKSSSFIYHSSLIEKIKFQDSFINFLKTTDVKNNEILIFVTFSLIECEIDMRENYDDYIEKLKQNLPASKIKRILEIEKMSVLKNYELLKNELS